jgi:protein-S-isoprenylcysteine O-methyltransferase Ste14
MSIWGVGPAVGRPTALFALAAITATFLWRPVFAIPVVPYPCLATFGVVLLLAALPFYVLTVRTIWKAHRQQRLVTSGVYAVCRHPIYAGWILLILPGAGLLLNSWLVVSTAVVMYVLTRIYVVKEEENLEVQFGREYADYKRRVGAIFPRFSRRR